MTLDGRVKCQKCGDGWSPKQMNFCEHCGHLFCNDCFREILCDTCHDNAIRQRALADALAAVEGEEAGYGIRTEDREIEEVDYYNKGIKSAAAAIRYLMEEK